MGGTGQGNYAAMSRASRWIAAAASIAALLQAASRAEDLLFIESYHNLDYAAVACRQALDMRYSPEATAVCKSVPDPRQLGRRLENSLMDALATTTTCAGVKVARSPHPDFDGADSLAKGLKLKANSPHWELLLDYEPGQSVFGWTLVPLQAHFASAGSFVNGEGNLRDAAEQICIVVTHRGATIR